MKQLKEFQKTGVKFLIDRKTALLADDMGLGKTVQAAAAINELKPQRVLVLTLASLKINWERELRTWADKYYNYQIIFKTTDKIDSTANIIICNYDLIIYPDIKKQLRRLHYNIVILDEAHNLSNMEAKRSKAVYSDTGLIRTADRVYALTGTPVRNRPKDFYIMLKVLAPECIEPYVSYENYAQRYCAAFYDSYGALNDKGASNIEELAENIKPFMLRRTKNEVLQELPPLIEKTIELELTPDIQKVLDDESELEEDINDYNNSGLGVQATIRRELGLAKLPQVYEYIKNILEQQEKVVIFAYHRDVINTIRKDFAGYGCRVIMGGMGAKLKQMEVDLFVNDPHSRIFIGQYTAAGFGIDGLQKVASHVIFAEMDWVPGNIEQARDRIRRIGQNNPVTAHYLVIPNTLEDNMLQAVIKKGKVITRLLSNTEKEKEEKDMTLEQSLERIATALETIAGAKAVCSCNSCEEQGPAEEPKPAEQPKKKAAKKKAEAKLVEVTPQVVEAEPVEETTDDIFGTPAAEPAPSYTRDDLINAFKDFLGKLSDEDRNFGVTEAKKILTKYGYDKVPDVQEKDYANVISDLKAAA